MRERCARLRLADRNLAMAMTLTSILITNAVAVTTKMISFSRVDIPFPSDELVSWIVSMTAPLVDFVLNEDCIVVPLVNEVDTTKMPAFAHSVVPRPQLPYCPGRYEKQSARVLCLHGPNVFWEQPWH